MKIAIPAFKNLACLAAIFFSLCLQAQPWMSPKYLNTGSKEDPSHPNFYEIQKAFRKYEKEMDEKAEKAERARKKKIGKEDVDEEEGKFAGYNQFKRWEYYMERRMGEDGDITTPSKKIEELQKYLGYAPWNKPAAKISSTQSLNGNWTAMGPNGSHFKTYWGGSARLNFVRFDPTNNNTMWVGSPTGGLWKSTNAGQSWSTNTDQLALVGCADLAINPLNTNKMYMATGDADGYSTTLTVSTIGVLKSTDGGLTWGNCNMNFTVSQGRVIYKLLMNPAHPDTIFAATNVGIYKTDNGGASTWTVVPGTSGSTFTDLEFNPKNTQVIYATSGWAGSGKFYKSTDGGATFPQVTNGLPASAQIARCAIAVTAADTSVVYLVAVKPNTWDFYGFYASTDGGNNFSLKSNTPNILSGPAGAQAYYNLCIAASSVDKNKVMVGATHVYRTPDGGVTWNKIADGSNNPVPYTHPDHHDLQFLPGSDSTFFTANDGGLWKTINNAASWFDINNGLETGQVYRFGTSTLNPTKLLIGLQDMGHQLLQNNTWSFLTIGTGDGVENIISPYRDSTMYLVGNSGWTIHTANHGQNYNVIASYTAATGVNSAGNFVTPLVMHPTKDSVLLIGKDQVYRTSTSGTTWSQVGTLVGGVGKVTAIAYAPSDPNYIYAARSSKFYVCTNGNTFGDSTGVLPVSGGSRPITAIVVSDKDPKKVWVSFSGYTSGTKVYYSPDAGHTWSNFSYNLPNLPVNNLLHHKNSSNGLYAATDVGIYFISDSTNNTWQSFYNGLPNVDVEELEIAYSINKIRAATNARSMWESDPAIPAAAFTTNSLCETVPVNFTDASMGGPTKWQWLFPGGVPASSNVQNPSIIYNAPGTYTVTFISANANGSTTKTTTITVNALPATPTITAVGQVLSSTAASGNQWYLGGSIIGGATAQSYTATQNGNYTVIVTDVNGCTAASVVFNYGGTGLNFYAHPKETAIIPNPNNGKFSIEPGEMSGAKVRIYNVSGETIYYNENPANEMDLAPIAKGIYFVELTRGDKKITKKLIIQ